VATFRTYEVTAPSGKEICPYADDEIESIITDPAMRRKLAAGETVEEIKLGQRTGRFYRLAVFA
jgi:hypothetical protein